MKVLHFVLVLVFMFTLVVSPAQAKAGESYSFVPLVTKVNSAIPLRMQARQAFQRLLPQLNAAQKSGAILEFEPAFGAGILKIKYAAGANASTLIKAKAFNNIHAAVAQVPHTHIQSAGAHPEVSGPLFYPLLYDSCFDAYNLGNSSHVIATLLDKTGVMVANYSGDADTLGHLYDCLDWSGSYTDIIPGYRITYKIYDAPGTTLLGTYSAIVGNITFNTLDKATSVVGGLALAGKPFWIDWYHRNFNAANTTTVTTRTGTVSGASAWSVDFGTAPIRGGDYLDMYITQTNAFIFERELYPSYIYCESGGPYCGITGLPVQSASLTMTHAGVPYTFTGRFNNSDWFNGYLEDSAGDPIFMKAGDTASGTGVPVFTLPNLTAVAYYASDLLVGKAPVSKFFTVWVKDVSTGAWYSVWTHTDATGSYTANFHSQFDLKPTDALTFEVDYIDPVTGNETDRYITVAP